MDDTEATEEQLLAQALDLIGKELLAAAPEATKLSQWMCDCLARDDATRPTELSDTVLLAALRITQCAVAGRMLQEGMDLRVVRLYCLQADKIFSFEQYARLHPEQIQAAVVAQEQERIARVTTPLEQRDVSSFDIDTWTLAKPE